MTIPSPERIRQIRLSLGENQIQFAKRLGVRNNTVSRWEIGKRQPDEYPHVKMLMELDQQLAEQERE